MRFPTASTKSKALPQEPQAQDLQHQHAGGVKEQVIQAFDDDILWTNLGETPELPEALVELHSGLSCERPQQRKPKTLPPPWRSGWSARAA
jgi:hypothetical protein